MPQPTAQQVDEMFERGQRAMAAVTFVALTSIAMLVITKVFGIEALNYTYFGIPLMAFILPVTGTLGILAYLWIKEPASSKK